MAGSSRRAMGKALVRVDLKLHWGFWARPSIFSARQPTMSVPPPTTIVGAFARGLASLYRAMGLAVPEYAYVGGAPRVPLAPELGRCTDAVYFRILAGAVRVNIDKNRFFQAPYIREENLGEREQWFAVRDLGKAYAPAAAAEAALLVDVDCLADMGVEPAWLVAAGASLTRLGPTEGVVSPVKAELIPMDQCAEGATAREPCPYFPIGDGADIPEPWAAAQFVDWHDERAWTHMRGEARAVRYAVPVGAWATSQPEFPWCASLAGIIALKRCGGRTYPI